MQFFFFPFCCAASPYTIGSIRTGGPDAWEPPNSLGSRTAHAQSVCARPVRRLKLLGAPKASGPPILKRPNKAVVSLHGSIFYRMRHASASSCGKRVPKEAYAFRDQGHIRGNMTEHQPCFPRTASEREQHPTLIKIEGTSARRSHRP